MTAALLQGVPDHRTEDEALAAFGLVREQPVEPPVVEVWPENWRALQVFLECQTQWRVGPAGRTGLDHVTVRACIAASTPHRGRRRVLAQVQRMEAQALEHWAEQRARR